jgi:hypothetical protein
MFGKVKSMFGEGTSYVKKQVDSYKSEIEQGKDWENALVTEGSTLCKVEISPVDNFPPPEHILVKKGTLESILGVGASGFVEMFGPTQDSKGKLSGYYLQGSFPMITASEEISKKLRDGVAYISRANDPKNTDLARMPQMGLINPAYLTRENSLKKSTLYINGNYEGYSNGKLTPLNYSRAQAVRNNITKDIGVGMVGMLPKEWTGKIAGLLFPAPKVGDIIPVIAYRSPEAVKNPTKDNTITFPAVVAAGINRLQVPMSATTYKDYKGNQRSGISSVYAFEAIIGLDKRFMR